MRLVYYSPTTSAPPPVAIVPRAPLPPFDPDSWDTDVSPPAPLPVYINLREDPPPTPDVRWWRGDAWAITIPDLPLVPGGASGPAQSRVLTYFLDRYGRSFEERILHAHLERGYTHISISPQDSFAFGTSEDAYVAMAVRCREAGLNVHHLMRSKYYTPAASTATMSAQDATLNLLRDRVRRRTPRSLDQRDTTDPYPTQMSSPELSVPDALINRLLSEGAMQVETPAWEMNHWSPEIVEAMIIHDSDLIGMRCTIMLHFFPHYISWQKNSETPTDFWRMCHGRVDGTLYQCDPSWTAGMMAARETDCLDRLAPGGLWGLSDSGRGHPIDFVCWETIATKQFNNDVDGDGRVADEDIGNLKGYECECPPGKMIVLGYGNGGRLPDGYPL